MSTKYSLSMSERWRAESDDRPHLIQSGSPALQGGRECDNGGHDCWSIAGQLPNTYNTLRPHVVCGIETYRPRQTRHPRRPTGRPQTDDVHVPRGRPTVRRPRVGAQRGRLRYHIQKSPSVTRLQTGPQGYRPALGLVHRCREPCRGQPSECGRTDEGRQARRPADVHRPDHDVQHQRGLVLHGRRRTGLLHARGLRRPCPCGVRLPARRRLPATRVSRQRRVGPEGRDAALQPRRRRVLPARHGRTRRTGNGVGRGRERNGSRRRFGRGEYRRHEHGGVLLRRTVQSPPRRVRTYPCVVATDRDRIGASYHRTDGRPRIPLEYRRTASYIEGPRPRGDNARLFGHRLRGLDRYSGTDARRESVSRVGVQTALRVRRIQSRRVWYPDGTGQSGLHQPAVFEVRDDAPRKPHVTSTVLLPEVRLRGSRGLQRREERCNETTPVGAEVSGRRGDQSTRPEVGNAERERALFARQRASVGQTGSSPTNAGLQAGEVDITQHAKERYDERTPPGSVSIEHAWDNGAHVCRWGMQHSKFYPSDAVRVFHAKSDGVVYGIVMIVRSGSMVTCIDVDMFEDRRLRAYLRAFAPFEVTVQP